VTRPWYLLFALGLLAVVPLLIFIRRRHWY
jgi:integral membrane sensor domain MASE1